MTGLLRLYPGWWRRRYGDEVGALLASVPRRRGDRLDLVRGALDAWLHPPGPSRIPGASALVGGGLWTALAAGILSQPVPPDWPGYLVEILALAFVSVAFLLVALIGIAIRGFDAGGRAMGLLAGLAVVAFVAWMLAIVGSMSALADAATLAAAQTTAMVASVGIGLTLVRVGDERVGSLVLLAGVTMLIPWAGAWLAFGTVWTAIGLVLVRTTTPCRT
jgi:hypothetical protein